MKVLRQSGFTAVEILLVVVLIALTSTWLAFDFYRELDITRLKSEGLRMLRMARYAQMAAGQGRRQCIIHLNPQENSVRLEVAEPVRPVTDEQEKPSAPTIFDFENIYSEKHILPSELSFGEITVDREPASGVSDEITIIFYPDGTADDARVQIAGPTRKLVLIIDGITSQSKIVQE